MKRILTAAACAALAVSGLALGAPTAAADVTCRGTLTGYVGDTVEVPSGATCTLNNATVDGDVKVYRDASVTITGGRIEGNVQAESARSVVVSGTRVDGDIQPKYTTSTVNVTGTTVGGNIQVEEGRATVTLANNSVTGDVQLFKNPAGAKSVTANQIGGNLQCKENVPAPTGSGNTVRGSAEDQCRGLTGSGGGGGVDIYGTPGTHYVNGRVWNTTCEPYSQTERCRTNIQATVVEYRDGRFVKTNGWAFNNLTYLASPRALWSDNPLGAYGRVGGTARWTGSDGRAWRTECDTALTGQGGCRSFAAARVVEQTRTGYRFVTKEIFNNMVRFS
ncbi:polymer-forming cytoskeletal protein [Tessaracoccus flavus]|uniref:Uncharacterized protein n=1 Tax=Tessaracoccus flavus TaxID=1610493 RepID=A0A1Q2CEP9_9ACTN|nr:polymer-forming cytoskeletal protein [Tessaracoccus flavus]AQP44583.1 hypothetical protein RPIT_06950 [Tessaracoccus flavus]SDZ09183.1 hypothetical protein SAMN05428934_11055 [Tessaracoccus flavus]